MSILQVNHIIGTAIAL